MKIQINEIKRMQQLAGIINENKDESNYYGPEWIDPNSPKAIILTDVYYIGDNAEGDLSLYQGSAVPSYELPGYTLAQIKNESDSMLYIKKDEEGWYDEKEGVFESKDENSTTRIKKEYIKLI
jgi:hypothetical protein